MMHKKRLEGLSGGLFLIGLGLLFLVPGLGFWPWILVVVGAASLPASLAAKKGWAGWHSFVWMCGLAILFATGLFWPGILILVGASALIEAVIKKNADNPLEGDSPEEKTWVEDLGDVVTGHNEPQGEFDFDASPSTKPIDQMDVLNPEPEFEQEDKSDHNTRRLEE